MSNKITPLIQALISHYVSERDKTISELDNCINKSIDNYEYNENFNRIIELFKNLNCINGTLETIQSTLNLDEIKDKKNKKS